MIKHIVISGGGTLTLRCLGSLQYLLEKSIICYENIESIYGTSAGAIMGVCLSLKMDIHLISNYFVNRPWEDLYEVTPTHIYNLYSKKGIFDRDSIVKLLEPLLEYNNIPLDITLEDFYKRTNIDIHMFSIELSDMEIVDISHSSFPDLSLIDALYMTSCLPFVFEPFLYNDTYYVDAGSILNYPLTPCIENLKKGDFNESEILGLVTIREKEEVSCTEKITKSNLVAYSLFILLKLFKKTNQITKPTNILNTISYYTEENVFSSLFESVSSPEKREQYIKEGKDAAESFSIQSGVDKLG